MSTLYERIESLSKEKGFKNVTALCLAADVPRSTMTELKKGRSKEISLVTAQRLSSALGISVEYLLADEEMKDDSAILLQNLRDEDRALLAVTRSMTVEQVRMMTEFAKTMKGTNAND